MEQYYKLFSNSIPVKGYLRSVIIDIQRNNYFFIPNDLYEILTKYNNKSINEIKRIFNNKYDDIISEYFDFLYNNELIFWVDSKNELNNFPKINYNLSQPFEITNAIIDFEKNIFLSREIVDQLNKLNIQNIQLRFFSSVNLTKLQEIYSMFEGTMITNIESVITYSEKLKINNIKRFVKNLPKLTKLVICSSPDNELVKVSPQRYILCYKNKCSSNEDCGQIKINANNINYEFYLESINFNTCLKGKISIDANGLIKNCPSCKKNFGHFSNTKLDFVAKQTEFRKLWKIKKDDIDVCQDCEFRYICHDCRAFLKDEKNIYSQPLKCNYNPYIAKWKGETNWITVEEWRRINPNWKQKEK